MHTYNFFTIFYMLGVPGFPSGYWLAAEVTVEFFLLTDFFARLLLRKQFPHIWSHMWLLHDQSHKSILYLLLRLLASLPTSFVLKLALKDSSTLTSFGIACVRCLKVFRLRQISRYFDTREV